MASVRECPRCHCRLVKAGADDRTYADFAVIGTETTSDGRTIIRLRDLRSRNAQESVTISVAAVVAVPSETPVEISRPAIEEGMD